ncbi:MAG: ADP-ribosylglycohydrolase family protein [Betaproteobacteria bacterium]|nr:ADP-ribosylglycohydrolase family protein [Betaproteobacteria bacterium]
MNEKLADRIRGVLYGQAVGDALGLGTEFLSRAQVIEYYPHGLRDYADIVRDHHRSHWERGDWTDDTDQMLCILDSLLATRVVDERDIAARLRDWALAGGMGMGQTTASVLCDAAYLRDPAAVARRVWEETARRSAANGAIMRTSVLGVWQYPFPERVREQTERVCRITHCDPRCIASCVALCHAISALLEDALPLETILEAAALAAARHDPGVRECFSRTQDDTLASLDLDEGLGEGEANRIGYTYTALEAGLWALRHARSFEDGILRVVHEGGDADSNGAVAGALLGARFGFSAMPARWVAGLARGAELEERVSRFVDVLEHPGEAGNAVGTARAHRLAVEGLALRVASDANAAAMAREIERVLRFEIENAVPEAERLRARLSARTRKPARRTALISDIHGSHAGLLAALADIETQNCDRILCLGDVVEGGTGNEEVIETLRRLGIPCVRGNHDENNDVVLPGAARRYLANLPESFVEDDVYYVHVSPRARKRKINHAVEAWNVFDESDFRIIFIGHVHVPMIFGERSQSYGEAARHAFEYNRPFALVPDERYIVSVGAIGYGRDMVGKIRYAIYDREADSIELRAIDGPLLPFDHALGGSTTEFS